MKVIGSTFCLPTWKRLMPWINAVLILRTHVGISVRQWERFISTGNTNAYLGKGMECRVHFDLHRSISGIIRLCRPNRQFLCQTGKQRSSSMEILHWSNFPRSTDSIFSNERYLLESFTYCWILNVWISIIIGSRCASAKTQSFDLVEMVSEKAWRRWEFVVTSLCWLTALPVCGTHHDDAWILISEAQRQRGSCYLLLLLMLCYHRQIDWRKWC